MFTSVKNGMPGAALCLAVLVPTTSALAEEPEPEPASLSGTITAAGSGEPLEGITVVVSNTAHHFTVAPAAEAMTMPLASGALKSSSPSTRKWSSSSKPPDPTTPRHVTAAPPCVNATSTAAGPEAKSRYLLVTRFPDWISALTPVAD